MADNFTTNSGTGGDTFAADEIASVKHQRVKVQYGEDGSATDVSDTNPMPVDDAGGSLTVDNATLSVTGGGVEASALRVTIASDSTGVLSVDDNGSTISIDDGGGAITVDGTVGVSGTVTVAGAVTNAGTFAVQESGAALTALQLLDDTVATDGSATPTKGILIAGQDGTNAQTVRTDTSGRLAITDDSQTISVDDGGGALTVDGSVTVSGTVTADAGTGPWPVTDNSGSLTVDAPLATPVNVQVGDGSNTATIRNLAANDALNVAIVDGAGDQITTFGGGTQYTEGDTDASVTGTAVMWEDAADTLRVVSASKPLPVGDGGSTISVDDGGGVLTVDGTVGVSGTVTISGAVTNAGTFAVQESGAALTALQLIDDVVKTDDAAFTPAADKVVMVGAEFDDTTPDSVNEGDAGAVRMSANRNLYTTIRDAAGNERGVNVTAGNALMVDGSAVTQPISAASLPLPSGAATSANQSTLITFTTDVRTSTGTDSVRSDIVSGSLTSISNNVVPGTSGTSLGKAEDAAHTSGHTGVAVLAVRRDTAAVGSDTDGDYSTFNVNASGRLYVTAVSEANSGVDIGDVTINNASGASAVNIQDGGNSITVDDGSTSLTVDNGGTFVVQENGAALTALQLIDDTVATTGSAITAKGITACGTDGTNARALKTDTSGELQVDVVSCASHAVTNAGTFAVQESGSALTALQLIDDAVFTDDAAFTPGTSKGLAVGFQADETSPDSVNEGDFGVPRMTLDRMTIVTVRPNATGEGLDIFRSIDLDETEEDVKTSAGKVYGWFMYNGASTDRFVKFYNATAATVTVGTTTPVLTIPIPAGAAANVEFSNGIPFSTAICVAATTGVADNDTGAPAANEVVVNVFYK